MARRNQYEVQDNPYINEALSTSQMKRLNRKTTKCSKQQQKSTALPTNVVSIMREEEQAKLKPIVPKTENQKLLLQALRTKEQIIVTGAAGTGKTYITASYAADEFRMRRIQKIVLTRPNVSTGKTLGLFKGDMQEKYMHWLMPLVSVIIERMGKAAFDIAIARGDIVLQPLETIRGMSFENAFIIVDEAQNVDVEEMKAIVTRTGEGSTLVLTGDIAQSDIRGISGLGWAKETIGNNDGLSELTGVVEFTSDDIVRSKLVKMWIKAIEQGAKG